MPHTFHVKCPLVVKLATPQVHLIENGDHCTTQDLFIIFILTSASITSLHALNTLMYARRIFLSIKEYVSGNTQETQAYLSTEIEVYINSTFITMRFFIKVPNTISYRLVRYN